MERKRHRDRRGGRGRRRRWGGGGWWDEEVAEKVSGKRVEGRRMNAAEQPSEGWRCGET